MTTVAPTDAWLRLVPGQAIHIRKRHPDGSEATTYPGVVMDIELPAPWVGIRAKWTRDVIVLDGLAFTPGDTLHEYFSPEHPFNVFTVIAPDGRTRGWYANVTYPATLQTETEPWSLTWHDLFIDLVGLPDGNYVVRDEDELAEAQLEATDPALYGMIVAARDEMIERFTRRGAPFHE